MMPEMWEERRNRVEQLIALVQATSSYVPRC
jgi:hypothetical protein